ncbi:MAG: hypothetical protein QGG64_19035, partial [Candidatus Latescibacteria bacterium]|nr:hypothetical protein [Candidatus Latescibacterota bacterium]
LSKLVIEGAREAGLDQSWAFHDRDALTNTLRNYLKPGDLMLVKGSRGIAMENIVTVLGFDI